MEDFSQYIKSDTSEKHSTNNLVDHIEVFGNALSYSLVQNHVNAVGEIAEKATGYKLLPNMQMIGAPAMESEGSSRWHVQQFGNAAGAFVPCALLMKGFVGIAGKDAGFARQTLASGLAGTVYGGLLTPSGKSLTASELLNDRLTSAASTGASFAFVHLLSTGAFKTAEALTAGDLKLAAALKTRTGAALVSAPVGYIAADLEARLHGREATEAQKHSSMYTFSLMSFAAGGRKHKETSREQSPSPVELFDRKSLVIDGAQPAAKFFRPATARFLSDTAPLRAPSALPHEFLLDRPVPLSELTARLSKPMLDSLVIEKPRSEPAEPGKYIFENETRQAITVKSDSGIPITMPVEYAEILNKVRMYRESLLKNPTADKAKLATEILGEHSSYADRALPEDFLLPIDKVPDKGIIKRLVLMDEPNPEDAINRILLGDSRYYSAAVASRSGEITFFQRMVDTEINAHTAHEWSHLLRYSLENNSHRDIRTLPQLFDVAAAAENSGPLMQGRAAILPEEAWAGFAEETLAGSGAPYQQLLKEAPARSAMMGRALSESLKNAELSGTQGMLHEFWKQRSAEMQAQLPLAIDRMVKIASNGLPQSNDAARFIAYTGTTANLQAITGLTALDLSGQLTSDAVLTKLPGVNWLNDLNISSASISDRGLGPIGQLPLRSLNVSHNFIGDIGARNLARISTLVDLNMSNTRLTATGLSGLLRIQTLKSLSLAETPATSAAPAQFRNIEIRK